MKTVLQKILETCRVNIWCDAVYLSNILKIPYKGCKRAFIPIKDIYSATFSSTKNNILTVTIPVTERILM